MEIKSNRTEAYRFTIDLRDENDMKYLHDFRGMVKSSNKISKLKHRVELKGRLGKNNPNSQKYRDDYNHRGPGWKQGAYQRIRLEDAQFADVYLYEKSVW